MTTSRGSIVGSPSQAVAELPLQCPPVGVPSTTKLGASDHHGNRDAMAAVFKWGWTDLGADLAWTSSFGALHTSPIATTRFNETWLWIQILKTQNTVIAPATSFQCLKQS